MSRKVLLKRNPIFQGLPPAVLVEAARYLGFNTNTSENPTVWFSSLSPAKQEHWLDSNRSRLEDEFCSVGSWSFLATETYDEIVCDLAQKIGVLPAPGADVREIETAIVTKLWNDAMEKMTPEQLAAIREELEDLASKHGKSLGMEFSSFAALSAAQMSGFGVYLFGSTVLGAINGALGLGLSFGAFTGLSSMISIIVGPVGWAALGLAAIMKLGAPNYKKILPVVILVAKSRPLISERDSGSQPEASAASSAPGDGRSADPQLAGTHVPPLSVASGPDPDPELIMTVRQEIDLASRQKAKDANPLKPRKLSKLERNIFKLKNHELCKMAESLGVDYLDQSLSDQQLIQECIAEQKDTAEKSAADAKHEAQKRRNARDNSLTLAPKTESGSQKCVKNKRAEYRQLLEHLDFTDAAMLRLCESSIEDCISLLGEFRRLNQGHFNPKCTLPQTYPKVLEQAAGRDGRIYYRPRTAGSLTMIELVGTKATQKADIEKLRAGRN